MRKEKKEKRNEKKLKRDEKKTEIKDACIFQIQTLLRTWEINNGQKKPTKITDTLHAMRM